MVNLDRGDLADDSFDKKIEVREDYERRSQGRTRVILDYQSVTLKLPVDVTVGLHFRESGAVWPKKKHVILKA